jgi:hypothetical protein
METDADHSSPSDPSSTPSNDAPILKLQIIVEGPSNTLENAGLSVAKETEKEQSDIIYA